MDHPRPCGTCTKCCEGWLHGNIKNYEMYPGKPCYFVEIGKGCTIYEDRPKDPCKTFSCAWTYIEEMPDEFRPEVSGTIIHWRKDGYWVLSKAPNNPSLQMLSWALTYALSRNENILWYIDNKSYWIGDEEFAKAMEIKYNG